MKRNLLVILVFLISVFAGSGNFKDGLYIGGSRSSYTDEPFYGFTRIKVENGQIIQVDFYIRDSVKHELFDDTYERYFAGNDLYIQQCRNDRKGILSYPDSLLKHQDIGKVDVISGATWSYNIFRASVNEALSQAGDVMIK
jgi:major membrane immunogen (membrane-anchored lipoprotein)